MLLEFGAFIAYFAIYLIIGIGSAVLCLISDKFSEKKSRLFKNIALIASLASIILSLPVSGIEANLTEHLFVESASKAIMSLLFVAFSANMVFCGIKLFKSAIKTVEISNFQAAVCLILPIISIYYTLCGWMYDIRTSVVDYLFGTTSTPILDIENIPEGDSFIFIIFSALCILGNLAFIFTFVRSPGKSITFMNMTIIISAISLATFIITPASLRQEVSVTIAPFMFIVIPVVTRLFLAKLYGEDVKPSILISVNE